jgi:hypothetical protein
MFVAPNPEGLICRDLPVEVAQESNFRRVTTTAATDSAVVTSVAVRIKWAAVTLALVAGLGPRNDRAQEPAVRV